MKMDFRWTMFTVIIFVDFSCWTHRAHGLSQLHLFVDDDTLLEGQQTANNRGRRAATRMNVSPTLMSYHVISKITARYVSTSAVATLTNNGHTAQQAAFTFEMSPGAFISGFTMTVDGVAYVAEIRERRAAEEAYDQAISRGQNTAHVSQEPSSAARFSVDLNLQGGVTAVFNLTYQEVLQRRQGRFSHSLHITPGQITNLRVDVSIVEPQGLSWVDAVWTPSEDDLRPSVTSEPPSTHASVTFESTKQRQSLLSGGSGLHGVLSVTYDVIPSYNGGHLQMTNGYFVHYISPDGLPPAPKKVLFLIDISASMYGAKMAQTVAAVVAIMEELREIDTFNILTFSNEVQLWREMAVAANLENRKAAQKFVTCIQARGATDLQKGLLAATEQFNTTEEAYPAIVLLSDGRPNLGETDPNAIVSTMARSLGEKVALFTIGIGQDVDDALLHELASTNQGLYRKVFIDSSAVIQISGFFRELATPLLYDVAVRYQNGSVDENSLTERHFISYLQGSELVVTGRLAEGYRGDSIHATVDGRGLLDHVQLNVTEPLQEHSVVTDMGQDFAERMWAYLTIKSCLTRAKRDRLLTDPPDSDGLNAKALELSLKYSFVTPLASIVVLRPSEVLPTERVPVPVSTPVTPPIDVQQLTPAATAASESKKAGGDPHFIVQVPHTNLTICFDIQAKGGTIVNLLRDSVLGINVNAEVVPVNLSPTDVGLGPSPGLFGSLGVQLEYYTISISSQMVVVDSEVVIHWGVPRSIVVGDFNITMHNMTNMTISVYGVIEMHFKRHYQWPHHPDHFDFSMKSNGGGLLGQFQYKSMYLVEPDKGLSANGHIRAVMDIVGQRNYVFRMVESIDTAYECWWAPPDVFLDKAVTQYYVPEMFSHREL